MVDVFDGFTVYHGNQLWANVVDPDRRNAEVLVADYCAQNQKQYIPNEWVYVPSRTVLSVNTLNKILGANPLKAASAMHNPWVAKEGDVGRIKINPFSFT